MFPSRFGGRGVSASRCNTAPTRVALLEQLVSRARLQMRRRRSFPVHLRSLGMCDVVLQGSANLPWGRVCWVLGNCAVCGCRRDLGAEFVVVLMVDGCMVECGCGCVSVCERCIEPDRLGEYRESWHGD